MRTACAWCGADMGDDGKGGEELSHGICSDCSVFFLQNVDDATMGVFLDRLPVPVLVVDDDVRILDGNEAALRLVGRKREEAVGFHSGDVFECAFARLPGGCGKSLHCRGCAIRNSVGRTRSTGESVADVPCYLRQVTRKGEKWKRFLVSTARMGEIVLLKIVDAGEFTPPEELLGARQRE